MVYHKQDILFKGLAHAFIPDLFEYLEMLEKEHNENYKPLPCKKIKSLHSGELLTDRYRSLLMDFVYLMEDDSYLHYEHFSKNLSYYDIDRTLNYDVELHMENDEALVDSIIISTGDSSKSKTSVKYSNFNSYAPAKVLFLKDYDGDKRLNNLRNNIKNNNELTSFDGLDIMLIPFFNTTMDSEEVVIELCKLANEIPNLTEKQEDRLFWGLWLTTEIFIPDEKKLEKVRTMTLLNGKNINEILHKKEYEIREESIEEGREEGREEKGIEIAGNMLIKGYALNEISEMTGLNINSIKQLKLGK